MTKIDHDIEIICDAVAVVTKADPMAVNRERANVDARRIAYKICRDVLNLTYIRIAKYFNNNHATVLHGLKHFDDLFDTDKEFRKNYNTVMQVIGSLEFSDNPIVDPHNIIVDYVNLQTDHVDITQKYEMLLRSLHNKVTEKLDEMLHPICNDVLHDIIKDENCSKHLKKTLHGILVFKNQSECKI